MSVMKKLLFVFIFLMLTQMAAASPPRVAVLYTKSAGDFEQFENMKDVAQFALDEFNQRHKEKIQIDFIEVDDKGSVDAAVNSLKEALQSGDLKAVLGPLYSNVALGIKDFITKNQLPTVATFATHSDLTKNSVYMFQLCVSNKGLVKNLIEKISPAIEKAKYNITVFKDLADSYSTNLADSFKKELTSAIPKAQINEVVFRGPEGLEKLKDTNSKVWSPTKKDLLFLSTQDTLSSRILSEMESEPALVATIDPVNFYNILQKVKKRKIHVKLISTSQWVSGASKFSSDIEASFKRKFKHNMQVPAALTFDGVWALALGLDTSAKKKWPLQEALKKMPKYYGLTGPLTFGPDGNRKEGAAFIKEDILE